MREFHIRLPQGSIDYKLLKAMGPGESLRVRKNGTFVIVEFRYESGWDGEDDGTRWMASLMPLRSDLLRGDYRCLYFGWLRSAQDGGLDEDKLEPPVPAGLEELSGPLHALIEFLEILSAVRRVHLAESLPWATGSECEDKAHISLETSQYALFNSTANSFKPFRSLESEIQGMLRSPSLHLPGAGRTLSFSLQEQF